MSMMKAPKKCGKCGGGTCKTPTKKKATGLNPPGSPPKPVPVENFTDQHRLEFEGMQENCYKHLHRPWATRVRGQEKIYYVCNKCMDKYMKKHEELKELVVSFPR